MSVTGSSARGWDVAIVGGGHNGLVAAFYLAKAGLRTVVLERREIVGGCAVTEEFSPGFRASTGAYVLSMLREPVWRDLRLVQRGVAVDPAGPTLNLGPDGSALLLDDDLTSTQEEFARFSPADARALGAFEAELGRIAKLITPLIDVTPPDPRSLRPRDLARLARLGGMAARHRALIADATFLFGTSATQYLREWFSSDQVLAALGWHAINDSTAGPSTPGTAYVLLHDHASEDAGGGIRKWGFVRGGIGRLPEAMADAAREAGAQIRTEAPVERIVVEDGRATGVLLADGEEIAARRVLSNADPKTTLLRLVDEALLPDASRPRCTPTAARARASRSTSRSTGCRWRPRSTARGRSPTTEGSPRSTRRSSRWTRRRPRRGRGGPRPIPTSSCACRRSMIRRWRPRAST